jgi:quercetin dioxygenase-like cupin family protein
MIVSRWQSSDVSPLQYAKAYFESEGLADQEETLAAGTTISDHRHPFDEIRIVIKGAMLMNIAGTQLMLREGDRIEIPAHTRHAKKNEESVDCVCLVAQKPF